MAFPSHSRSAEAVLDAVHRFDDANPTIRRWWSDSAPEFSSAARTIRTTRPLAHYRSTPYRPQANGKAERKNRLAIAGARCLLLQSGLSERWWPLAICCWAAMYNATFRGMHGLTPWHRRFNSEPEYQIYPFGALVLYQHPSDAPVPKQTAHGKTGPKSSTKKWRNRLVPSIFIGPTQGPGGQWAQSYQIVLLASILSSYRASRVSIRTVHDVIFPEVVSFPLRQRLNLQGAFEDLTLPSPHFSDDTEQWSIVTDEVGSADVLEYDGLLQENAFVFRRHALLRQ